MARTPLTIDIVSDVICPWCFLGKRRLDRAVALVPDIEVTINWRPFFLDPTIPPLGIGRRDYLAAKFGEERLKTLHDPLVAAGKDEGVPFEFDKITRTPNTLDAHRLIRWAKLSGMQQAVVEALFMAYWHEGRDVGDVATLAAVASATGMDGKQVLLGLASDDDKQAVMAEVAQAQAMGVRGVPTFILAQRYGIAGAQSAENLAQGMRQAVEKQV